MGRLQHALRACGAALVAYHLRRYARARPDGDHVGLVTMGYLFICLHPVELVLRTCGSSRAAMSQMVGAGAQVTHGGPGASPGREAGAGATRARGGPGVAPSLEVRAGAAGTRGSPGTAPSQEAGAVVLT
jgi:hypothetical protein